MAVTGFDGVWASFIWLSVKSQEILWKRIQIMNNDSHYTDLTRVYGALLLEIFQL